MNEWLCLDAPEACDNVIENPLITAAYHHLEGYSLYLDAFIQIDSSEEEDCMTVGFRACYWDLNVLCTEWTHVNLTAAGHARATGLGARLMGMDIGPSIRHPYLQRRRYHRLLGLRVVA